jgi:hypothetical protein
MALIVKDRVRETSATTGTGTLTLSGAVSGFQSFSAIGNANDTYYTIVNAATGDWEVGIGTYTASGTTLSRNQVLESSNAGALVNFGSGTKDVFGTYPADRSVSQADIGTAPNEIPLNQYLGSLAYQSAENIAGDVGVGGDLDVTGGAVIDGNVGIGTSSPEAFAGTTNVVVGGGSGNPAFTLYGGASTYSAVYFADGASGSDRYRGFFEYNHSTDSLVIGTAASTKATIDSSGNVGLGVTPSAWGGSLFKVIDIGATASVAGSTGTANLFNNAYYNGSAYIYKVTGASARYLQSGNSHYWYSAPSGTAGDAVSFTEKMQLDASGNLGIGTSAPTQRLDVNGNIRASTVEATSADSIKLPATTANIDIGTVWGSHTLNFRAGGTPFFSVSTTGGAVCNTGGFVSGLSAPAPFGTNINYDVQFIRNNSEQMRLTSTGLGIGTSSPTAKLDVNGDAQIGNATAGTNRVLKINGVANKASRIAFQESGVDRWLIGNGAASENGNFEIYDATSANQFVLTRSGNLGLGVTPSAWNTYKAIQVGWGALAGYAGQDTAVFSNVLFDGTYKYIGNGFASQYRQINSSHNWYTAPSGTAGNAITFTQAMTLDASGNLGIGTSSPAYKLDVASGTEASGQQSLANFRTGSSTASYNAGVQIYGTASATATSRNVSVLWDADGANSSGGDYFFINKLGNSGEVQIIQSSNAPITISTYNTERMRIDASGNVGIGTSSPSTTLSVAGTAPVITIAPSSGTASSTITLSNPSQSWQLENQYVGGAAVGMFRLRDATAGTDVLTVNPSSTAVTLHRNTAVTGTLSITDNLVIGTAGKGIDFSADGQAAGMTSELLDDYEEGTWTPTLGGNTTYTSQEGTYTKVGRLVTVRGSMTVNVLGTGSTTDIFGIPFSSNAVTAGAVGYFASLATNVIHISCYTNATASLRFVSAIVATGNATNAPAIFGNGSRVDLTITYFV